MKADSKLCISMLLYLSVFHLSTVIYRNKRKFICLTSMLFVFVAFYIVLIFVFPID